MSAFKGGTLAIAVGASALVHGALFALPALERDQVAARRQAALDAPIVAELRQPQAAAQPVVEAPQSASTSIVALPAATSDVPMTPVNPVKAAAPERRGNASSGVVAPNPAMPASSDVPGEVRVRAEPVVALAELGDLFERTMNDYPREVQAPVRLYRPVEAVYPPEARAQGIEGTVIAWVLVDPNANVEEIEIVEGDPVFRTAVIDAIRAAAYQPAFDAGQGLHYPIALAFRFALDPSGTSGPAQVASAPGIPDSVTP